MKIRPLQVNRERLAKTFMRLCEIDSPSRQEGEIASFLLDRLKELGAEHIVEDLSAQTTGSQSGNLIASFSGNVSEGKPVFFICHMDTVEPGCGVEVERTGDLFTSRGDTILGGDDKSGIAALLEVLQIIRESTFNYRSFQLVLTTCEEIGLLGAKALEHKHIHGEFGYALDSTGIDRIVIGAPAANRLQIAINGVAAHAGLHPEQGVSAIALAAKSISKLSLGRLDEHSTANIGCISGGVASNIIPDKVVIDGEVRSHSAELLLSHTEEIETTFEQVVGDFPKKKINGGVRPSVNIETWLEYPQMIFSMDHPVVEHVRLAGQRLGRDLRFEIAGGGSDANILNSFGLPTVIIATGMTKVHTTDESLNLNDLVGLTELLLELVRCP